MRYIKYFENYSMRHSDEDLISKGIDVEEIRFILADFISEFKDIVNLDDIRLYGSNLCIYGDATGISQNNSAQNTLKRKMENFLESDSCIERMREHGYRFMWVNVSHTNLRDGSWVEISFRKTEK